MMLFVEQRNSKQHIFRIQNSRMEWNLESNPNPKSQILQIYSKYGILTNKSMEDQDTYWIYYCMYVVWIWSIWYLVFGINLLGPNHIRSIGPFLFNTHSVIVDWGIIP